MYWDCDNDGSTSGSECEFDESQEDVICKCAWFSQCLVAVEDMREDEDGAEGKIGNGDVEIGMTVIFLYFLFRQLLLVLLLLLFGQADALE